MSPSKPASPARGAQPSTPAERRRLESYARPCSYLAAHQRVYTSRGAARNWRCIKCGEPAQQWAYRVGSPRQMSGQVQVRRRSGNLGASHMLWSPDPADYDPMCRLCHGLATRSDYNAGYRSESLADQAAKKREWRRAHYMRQTSTPEGREAYRARKQRESTARASRPTDPHHTPAPPIQKEN